MVTVQPAPTEISKIGGSEFAQFKKAFREFHGGMHQELLEELGPKVLTDLHMNDLPGRVEKLADRYNPLFRKDDLQNHVFTLMEIKRGISGDPSCDVHVLFDGDRTRLGDPTVAMEARWREAGGKVEMTNATMSFKKRGSTALGGDFKVWFDPHIGQMTGLEITNKEMQAALRAVMYSERGAAGVNPQGAISFVDNPKGFEAACKLLALHTGLEKEVFQDGFDVRKTLANFIETGTLQERAGVVSPVIIKEAS